MSRRRKKRRYTDIPEARTFLWKAYGMKSKIVNHYHLQIVHEEYLAIFNWYHTTGTLVASYKHSGKNLGTYGDVEDVAIKINKVVGDDLKYNRNRWYKKKVDNSPCKTNKTIYNRIEAYKNNKHIK